MTDTKTELLIFRDNLSFPEGVITLEYPAKMSASSYQYFVRWVQIVLDKTKNSMILEGTGVAGAGEDIPTLGSWHGRGGQNSNPTDLGSSGVPNIGGGGMTSGVPNIGGGGMKK